MCLQALGVVGVEGLAGTSRAANSALEVLSAALAVESSAASVRGLARSGRRSGRGRSGRSRGRRSSRGGRGRSSAVGLLVVSGRSTAGGAASPDGRSWNLEGLEAVVNAEVGVVVGGLVGTGELDSRTGGSAAAASDLDLGTADIVLGLVDVGSVNTNVLNAEEVFTIGGVLGDSGTDGVLAVRAPGALSEVTAGRADSVFVDLEPFA